ncbi:MAG TPA: FxsA family protein [Longimicrobiales bacterium]|nr:FxsA family protein [Longimicrobiales bacterium]
MFARLALLFIVIPLVELALLIQVGRAVGLLPTILLVLATGVGGAALARREGLRTLAAIQAELARGALPGASLLDGAAVLFGGTLLLTPGILTDLLGFTLLLPATRRWFAERARRWFEGQLAAGRVHWVVSTPGMTPWGGGNAADAQDEHRDPARRGLDPRHEIDGE